MKKVFIIHGYMGWPNKGWKAWLMNELSKKELYACALPMPNTYDPKKEEWVSEIKRVLLEDPKNTVLVGHSLGVSAILRFIEESNTEVHGIVLVSGAIKQISEASEKTQTVLSRFMSNDFDWSKIKKLVKHIKVIHGVDDSLVPVQHAKIIGEKLNVTPIILSNGGHLSDDCHNLPEVLNALLEIIE